MDKYILSLNRQNMYMLNERRLWSPRRKWEGEMMGSTQENSEGRGGGRYVRNVYGRAQKWRGKNLF
jgi:hypothetical protein